MKDIFNRRQRFSLRKYSFGVASVLLGTALFAAHTAQADEVTAPDASSSNPGTSVEGESSSDLVETSTASTAQADPTAAVSSTACATASPVALDTVYVSSGSASPSTFFLESIEMLIFLGLTVRLPRTYVTSKFALSTDINHICCVCCQMFSFFLSFDAEA